MTKPRKERDISTAGNRIQPSYFALCPIVLAISNLPNPALRFHINKHLLSLALAPLHSPLLGKSDQAREGKEKVYSFAPKVRQLSHLSLFPFAHVLCVCFSFLYGSDGSNPQISPISSPSGLFLHLC